jgi:ubiquinone/menaquinone biosynthesis C-methylase UbiE
MKPQVELKHYYNNKYDSKGRFISYWHQINEIINLNPDNILEIGIGNGFVSKYLKDRNFNLTTLDIDERLKPDKIGSVLNIPFCDNCFDVVACYELLEHIDYIDFPKALSEIYRVSKSNVIISLPDRNRIYRIFIQIPKVGIFKRLIPVPTLKKKKHVFDGEHYWEIGKLNYPLDLIKKDIKNAGFNILKTYRIFEHPYHRFFILRK